MRIRSQLGRVLNRIGIFHHLAGGSVRPWLHCVSAGPDEHLDPQRLLRRIEAQSLTWTRVGDARFGFGVDQFHVESKLMQMQEGNQVVIECFAGFGRNENTRAQRRQSGNLLRHLVTPETQMVEPSAPRCELVGGRLLVSWLDQLDDGGTLLAQKANPNHLTTVLDDFRHLAIAEKILPVFDGRLQFGHYDANVVNDHGFRFLAEGETRTSYCATKTRAVCSKNAPCSLCAM